MSHKIALPRCCFPVIVLLLAIGWSQPLYAQATLKFDLGDSKAAAGYTVVSPTTISGNQTSYGIESGFPVSNYNGKGLDDGITSDQPFFFSAKLKEGIYQVRVRAGHPTRATAIAIKAECRRLMTELVQLPAGTFSWINFTVHVRDSMLHNAGKSIRLKPRESSYRHWDDQLTLEFNGSAPNVCAIEISAAPRVPVVFLAGNSTVVDQASEPWAAWGQMIPAFFKPGAVAVANYAESGETLKSFERAGRLEKILGQMRPGDYLFIEFAHNDQKPGGNYLEPFTTYRAMLMHYIDAVRAKGGIPVLVTSMHRRNFDSTGHIVNTLGDYPEAVRLTGKEQKVPVVDLNAMSKRLYEAWGPEESIKAFVHYPANSFPDQPAPLKDNTHFSNYGAYQLARCVAQAIRELNLPLAGLLRADLPAFDPAQPTPFNEWNFPASPVKPAVKPDGN